MQLENQLYQLLFNHNCVILPGFGGFIGHQKSAEILPTQGYIRQPHKSVSFNKNLVTNDGVVYNFIAHKLDITYNRAEEICKEFTLMLHSKLQNGESVVFHNIGKLFLDFEKNIQFFPNHDENFERSSYGLKKISIQPITYKQSQEEKIIIPPVKSIVETAAKKETVITFENKEKLFRKEQEETTQAPTLPFAKIAAAFVLAACITASFLMMVNHQTGNSIGQQAGIFDTIVNVVFHKNPTATQPSNKQLVNANTIEEGNVNPIKSQKTIEHSIDSIDPSTLTTPQLIPTSTKTSAVSAIAKKEEPAKQELTKIAEKPVKKETPKATVKENKPEEKIKKAEATVTKEPEVKKNKEEAKAADVSVAHVVFGSFKSDQNAKALLNKLSKEGIKATIQEGDNGFKRVIYKTNTQKAEKLRSNHPGSWTLEQIGK